jgi:hypothetical protein
MQEYLIGDDLKFNAYFFRQEIYLNLFAMIIISFF